MNTNTKPSKALVKTDVIKRFLFGYKYLIIDNETKIEYGFHLSELGKSYNLKKWSGSKWVKVAWTYHSTHDTKEGVISYLLSISRNVNYKDKVPYSLWS